MSKRITSVAIPANAAWKITNDASVEALRDAAVRLVLDGGDPIPGKEEKGTNEKSLIVNLRTDDEIAQGATPLLAPTVLFNDLGVVDREEIEDYRSIQQLLFDYKEKKDENKPISIGVFGPPGSGKSFGVKEVAATVEKKTEALTFNLAQFSDPEQLGSAFLKIRNEGTGGKTPLAFFDEFDSSLRGDDLGWLRYLLAPMQDGEFFFDGNRQKIGRAILVFAGGTSGSLRHFSREDESDNAKKIQFQLAKGPDFISRLSGNITVLGVNRRDDAPDQSYILRRAVIIRSQLRRQKLVGRTNRALVDKRFLYKLLDVGRYKHGARSVEMIIKMCVGQNGQLHLPPADQLIMHVDKSDAEKILG